MNPRSPILALFVCLASITQLSAQPRTWISNGNILWDNPANWSPNDAPDSASESAVFDRFGNYRAALSDAAPTPINDLSIDRGEVLFQSAGFDAATLSVAGDSLIGGELELENVSIETAGHLELTSGAKLTAEGVSVSAASTSIAGGSLTEATYLLLDDGATASLGDTLVVSTLGDANRSGLDLFDGGMVTVHDLGVSNSAGNATSIGEVNVSASILTQTLGGVATVGQASPLGGAACGARCGTLNVSDGGTLDLRSLTIGQTGTVLNLRSQFTISNSLTIEGGVYEERFEATRTLGSSAALVVRGAGQLILSNSPLTLTAGQSLRLEDSATVTGQPVVADGGTVTVGADSIVSFSNGFENVSNTLTIEAGAVAAFAGEYAGSGASGPGMARFEGSLSPGQSPGAVSFGGDIAWSGDAEFVAQIAGEAIGQYDSITAAGSATLDGLLTIELLDDNAFVPEAGDSFTLLTASAIDGAFDTLSAPTLPGGLGWRIEQRPTSLTLRVIDEAGLAGDFNADGFVDAADYTLWRDTQGSAGPSHAADANGDQTVDGADLAAWRANYGSSAATAAIPEPGGVGLVVLLLAVHARKVVRREIRA